VDGVGLWYGGIFGWGKGNEVIWGAVEDNAEFFEVLVAYAFELVVYEAVGGVDGESVFAEELVRIVYTAQVADVFDV
jgi:hypothetical protein